uniref:(northern house mosquito) hypothetical protein n=1 Tax=Culex pipiens TaxID=7175 RepID=A0A8D8GDI8_CULPI
MVERDYGTVFAVVEPPLGWDELILAVSWPQGTVRSKSRNPLLVLDRLVHAAMQGHVRVRHVAQRDQRFHVVVPAVLVPIVQTHGHRRVPDIIRIEIHRQIALRVVAVRVLNAHLDATVRVGCRFRAGGGGRCAGGGVFRWSREPVAFPFLFGGCGCHKKTRTKQIFKHDVLCQLDDWSSNQDTSPR